MAIAAAATRWAGDPRAHVVGALLLEPEVDETDMLGDAFGVHAISGIEEVAAWVQTWGADMVVVAPGPGVTSADVRRLGWDLEGTDASLAVLGVLDLVSPHRIDTTRFAGATLLHVRSSRPSTFIRGLKSLFDRLVGGLILLLTSPLLLVMTVLVRMESDGPASSSRSASARTASRSRCTRCAPCARTPRHSRPRSPRSTRATGAVQDEGRPAHHPGRPHPAQDLARRAPPAHQCREGRDVARRPRPALPNEVANYDDTARRRLAVRPGLTGLWQVSGRSNLSWEKSIELDLSYADNWRLTDDILIGFKTVDAVTRSRGAY